MKRFGYRGKEVDKTDQISKVPKRKDKNWRTWIIILKSERLKDKDKEEKDETYNLIMLCKIKLLCLSSYKLLINAVLS